MSRWSFTKNHYMMYGQQNVKISSIAGSLVCAISANHVSCIYLSQNRGLRIRVFVTLSLETSFYYKSRTESQITGKKKNYQTARFQQR